MKWRVYNPMYCVMLRCILGVVKKMKNHKNHISNLAQMFSFEKFCAEQFSSYKLFDLRPSSFPKFALLRLQGNTPKNKKEILEF